jgi:Phage P2 baseplate assembly protein gpV
MEKNLLSDTDYTKGWDNRFGVAVVIAKVTKIECTDKAANVRCQMPDRVDHQDQPLISKPIPVMQIASTAKKSYAIPRLKDNVVLVKLPNGTSNYMVMGSYYSEENPPPIKDPMVDYTEWEGGHIQKYDANTDENGKASSDVFLTQDFKGGWDATIKKDVNFKTTDSAKFNIESDGHCTIKSANGDVNIQSPSGKVNIEQQEIVLTGTVRINGNIIHQGNMTTTGGHHLDDNGLHTGGKREEELAQRVGKLEVLLAAVETRLAALESGRKVYTND